MILFLDFDGVLHPDPPSVALPLWCRAQLLGDWLNDRQSVEVVISSTWRNGKTLREVQSLLPQSISDKVVGMTTQIQETFYARQLECEAWMKSNRPAWETWLALDDRSWNFRPFEKRLVLCNRSTGLLVTDLQKLDELLLKSR